MQRLLTIFLLSSFLMSCQPAPNADSPEPAAITHTYIISDAPFLNPERGFFTPHVLPGPAGFSSTRLLGNTLVHLNIHLDEWRESDIPQETLDGLDSNFSDIRDAGVKAIIRFAYNDGPWPDSEPDASKAQILRHIGQLTPLLQKNTDVIAWVEAGFIGAWGEWHTSTNGLDNITDKREILHALIAAIPGRYVQVRYPANIIEMYPNPEDAAKAYVAHHNDCFLSSETDVGTYERDGEVTIERDKAYLAELTSFTPMSGETCAPFPPRSECTIAIQEMELLHFSAINEAYHKGILRSWEQGGCMEEIKNRLGYRLALTSAEFNERVRPGGLLKLTVNITNSGFASLMNPRPLYVVLFPSPEGRGVRGEGGIRIQLQLDPRTWQPGNSSFTAAIRLPSNMEEGEYTLALWLPDEAESLQNSPLYAVQFANENMWDESNGFNNLDTVKIDSAVPGTYLRGDSMRVEELFIKTAVPAEIPVPAQAATIPPITPTPEVISSTTDEARISNIQLSNKASFLTIRFDFTGSTSDYNGYQVLLDSDQDPSTGFSINGIGAEFLLENEILNSYSGSGSDWAWTDTGVAVLFESRGNTAQWLFDASSLGQLSALDFVCQLADTNWETVFVSPKASFTLE